MMKLVIAVQFDDEGPGAWAAAVGFEAWDSPEPEKTWTTRIAEIGKPPKRGSGEPDLREVACILQLMREHALVPELIVIDGFVHLDVEETPALGLHLYQALGGNCPVMGVSKSARPALPEQFEVLREEETRPLLVTCVGIDLGAAKARLRAMHGRKRVPTLLKLAARLAKAGAA